MKKINILIFFIFALLTIEVPDIFPEEKISLENLEFLNTLPLKDQGIYFKTTPRIAIDYLGNIYALDNREHTVYKLDHKGNLLTKIGKQGKDPGKIEWPFYISTEKDRIFISDDNAISIFDLNGNFISRFRKFQNIISMGVLKDRVFLAESGEPNLITIHDLKGKKVHRFGEKYKIDYSLYKGWQREVVDYMVNRGKIFFSKNDIFFISSLFGDVLRFDFNGSFITKKEMNHIYFVKKNKLFYFKRGSKKENNIFPIREFLCDAIYYENKIYLLLAEKGTHGEILLLDGSQLNIEKKYSYSNFQGDMPTMIKSRSIGLFKENGSIRIYISFYDETLKDFFIGVYKLKKGGEKK